MRDKLPKVFRRNYRIKSVGSARRDAVEAYVGRQLDHHPQADPRLQQRLAEFQIVEPAVDLSRVRYSAHGQFLYNLHVVLENADNLPDVRVETLRATRSMIQGVCRKKEWLLSRAGIVANHLHLSVGCGVDESPSQVALALLNNLAYAQGMKAAYRFGYYVGTFGNVDIGAMRHAARL